MADGEDLVAKPASKLTDADRQAIRAHKDELRRLLVLDRIETTWGLGERIAYHDGGQLLTAKYAGVSTEGKVSVWLGDGAVRAIPAEAVALNWAPDATEVFEERLSIMLEAGLPEEVARVRAEQGTCEYFDRVVAAQHDRLERKAR